MVKNTRIVTIVVFCGLALVPVCSAASASREAQAAADKAMSAYLAGHYPEALPDLEKARDAGVASGSQLYMLGYCYEAVHHDPEAAKTAYDAARARLETETKEKKPPLESFFYLVNYYVNQGEKDKFQTIAKNATDAIAAKSIKVGKDGTSQFRAGKLYGDAGDPARMLEYYRRSITAFASEKDPPQAYIERALEPVATADLGKGDPTAVADMWEKLTKLKPGVKDGDWNLGLSAIRAGRFTVARDAFHRAKEPPSERSQEAFYSEKLAEGAADLAAAGVAIPAKDADGTTISELTMEDLDARIKSIAQKAGELLARDAQSGEYELLPPLGPKAKPRLIPSEKLKSEISESHRLFSALVIERLLRKGALQEDAFTGGYAPLVIQDWTALWRNNHRPLIDAPAKTAAPKAG